MLKKLSKVNNVTMQKAEGSITVEAAFVMPIIIIAIFSLISLSFYLHDKSRIQGAVDITLHKVGFSLKHEAEISDGHIYYENISDRGVLYPLVGSTENEKRKIGKYLISKLSEGLYVIQIKAVEIKASKYKVFITVEINSDINIPGIGFLFHSFPNTIKGDYTVHNPTEMIRMTEVILETGARVKGKSQ